MDTIPATAHARTCASFTSGHGRKPSPGAPAPFRAVPCDCHASA